MHELDGHRALADGRGDALDRAGPHVPSGEHAGAAGLQQERLPRRGPVWGLSPAPGPSGQTPWRPSRSPAGSQSVRGTAPMKLNTAGVSTVRASPGLIVDDLDGSRGGRRRSSGGSSCCRATRCWPSVRSAGPGSWTCSCTDHRRGSAAAPCGHAAARKTAAWPAELPPPTTTTWDPRHSCASLGVAA